MAKLRSKRRDQRVKDYILGNPLCSLEQIIRNCNTRKDDDPAFREGDRIYHSVKRLVAAGVILEQGDENGRLYGPVKEFASMAEKRRFDWLKEQENAGN